MLHEASKHSSNYWCDNKPQYDMPPRSLEISNKGASSFYIVEYCRTKSILMSMSRRSTNRCHFYLFLALPLETKQIRTRQTREINGERKKNKTKSSRRPKPAFPSRPRQRGVCFHSQWSSPDSRTRPETGIHKMKCFLSALVCLCFTTPARVSWPNRTPLTTT